LFGLKLCFDPPRWVFIIIIIVLIFFNLYPFWIDVSETIAELLEPLTFSSDEELNNKEDSIVLLKMIDGDEKN
jgi:hypothetical protein